MKPKTHKVHIICWDSTEYDRIATESEIDKYRKYGLVKGIGYEGLIFNFKKV